MRGVMDYEGEEASLSQMMHNMQDEDELQERERNGEQGVSVSPTP